MFFQMGFMRRFDAGYAAAKKQIEAGRIGTPLVFKATSRDPFRPSLEYANPKSSGGMLIDMGIHDFDLARWFMGDVADRVGDRRDHRLSGARHGRRHRQRDCQPDVRERQARRRRSEPQRHLRLRHLDRDPRLGRHHPHRLPARDADHGDDQGNGVSHDTVPYFMERFRDAYTNQLQNFAQNVLHDRTPPITIDDGMEALRVGVAATRAQETGKTVTVADIT